MSRCSSARWLSKGGILGCNRARPRFSSSLHLLFFSSCFCIYSFPCRLSVIARYILAFIFWQVPVVFQLSIDWQPSTWFKSALRRRATRLSRRKARTSALSQPKNRAWVGLVNVFVLSGNLQLECTTRVQPWNCTNRQHRQLDLVQIRWASGAKYGQSMCLTMGNTYIFLDGSIG